MIKGRPSCLSKYLRHSKGLKKVSSQLLYYYPGGIRRKRLKTMKTQAGAEVVVYQFSGDQWGNHEVCAYFVEPERINFIVMKSRDKKLFDKTMSSFESLAKSYLPMKVEVDAPPGKPK